MVRNFCNDENGFVVSAELVLIATLLVIGLIVGMSEIQHAVVQELNDVGEAIGALNQSYSFTGFKATKNTNMLTSDKSFTRGSVYADLADDCDRNECAIACEAPVQEPGKP